MKQHNPTTSIPHSPYLPVDPAVALYNTSFIHLSPYLFTDFKTESVSWKETCYLHAGLNPSSPYRITGPDALRLFSETCVNSFDSFAIGATRHAVMCNQQGNVMADGLLLRLGENEFISYFLNPYINYFVDSGKYDVTGEDLTGQVFLFQIGGPRSLEVVEAVTQENLRDISFFHHRPSRIRSNKPGAADIDVRILRVGVAGTLAYEVHGQFEDAQAVYRTILEAGKPFGIKRLGMQVYGMNHTENGFYQSFLHFMPAWDQDAAFMRYLDESSVAFLKNIAGSAGTELSKRYCNPVEAGWSDRIHLDHDFVGRQALEKYMAQPKRRLVTLVWNPDDILDIYASHFQPGDAYQFMELPSNPIWSANNSVVYSDDVFKDGQLIGISSGRVYSYYYRAMISLCLLDIDQSQLGNEVEIVWGEAGNRQKNIRAKVGRFPYLDLPRNKEIDVLTLNASTKQ